MTTTTPKSASELEEMLTDGTVAKMFEGGKPTADFAKFIRDYAEAQQGEKTELAAQVREETQRILAEWLRDNESEQIKRLNLAPGGKSPQGKVPSSRRAPGARIDDLFGDHEDYLRAAWYRNRDPKALELQDQMRSIRDSFGSTIPADGGFLIPETLRANLLQIALESALVRPRATVIPMETLRVPFPVIDDTDHTSSVYGGMIGYWTEEAGALTTSSAKFGRTVLEAKKLTGYSEVPNELFQDSILSFSAFLNQVWPRAIAFFEDDAFINGSGTGEPLGVLNADAKIAVSRDTASKVLFTDIISMYTRMLPASLNSAVWVCSPAVIAQLLQLFMNPGGTTDAIAPPLWLNGGMVQGAPMMSILGRPLIVSEKVPDLGTAGDLSFVDYSYYLVGDRQAMQMESSPHYKFANDQTAVRIIERVDGRPWLNSALTPKNGGDTLSPIVTLA